MKNVLKNNMLYLIGGAIGAIGGYLYYMYVGCHSGSCSIISSPVMSVIWGAVIGGLVFSMFKKRRNNGETM